MIPGLNRVKTVFYEEKDLILKLRTISRSFLSHKNIGDDWKRAFDGIATPMLFCSLAGSEDSRVQGFKCFLSRS